MQVLQKDLKAVSLAMAVKDIRYYLQGVLFESNGAFTRLVATDGHRLHMIQTEDATEAIEAPVSFIMPSDMVKNCLKAKPPRGVNDPYIGVHVNEKGKIEANLPDGSTLVSQAIDGSFPDYCRIVDGCFNHSGNSEPEIAVYNPDYVSDATKAMKIYMGLSEKGILTTGIRPRGESVGILAYDNFAAFIMPLRGDISPLPNPAFAKPLQSPEPLRIVA